MSLNGTARHFESKRFFMMVPIPTFAASRIRWRRYTRSSTANRLSWTSTIRTAFTQCRRCPSGAIWFSGSTAAILSGGVIDVRRKDHRQYAASLRCFATETSGGCDERGSWRDLDQQLLLDAPNAEV